MIRSRFHPPLPSLPPALPTRRSARPRTAMLARATGLMLVALLARSAAARAGDPPSPPRTGGHVRPAPAAAYDTLRIEAGEGGPTADQAPGPDAEATLPLLLDTHDLGFGTSVVFGRLPGVREIGELSSLTAVQHVVIALSEWPAGYEALLPLGQSLLPEGADVIVVLPGYPPTHAAAEAWNYLRLPLRLVLVVDGPPANRAGIDELNRIRALERVIADMEYPSRSGFERLQRPLSFRVLRR